MAYPLAPMPTMGEFIQRATAAYGAAIRTTEEQTVGLRGPTTFRYLMRDQCFAVLQAIPDEQVLTPDVLRSLCVQLNIPTQDFGLSIG